MKFTFRLMLALSLILVITACKSGKKKSKNQVVVWELDDPDMLHPTNYQSSSSGYITAKIFQTLMRIDFKTLKFIPELAIALPDVKEISESILHITFEIRPEAQWDDDSPITAEDVAFSLKVIKNPKVDCHRLRPYFEFIDSIIFYDDNPKKFTFVTNKKYMTADIASGDFAIIPKSVYDPKGLMNDFTISNLNNNEEALLSNPKIIEFADEYNSAKFQREKGYIVGSGAYEFIEWQTGRRIILHKKKDWWGDKAANTNMIFEANAKKLVYEIINDQSTAVVTLKSGKLDVMRGIPFKSFVELPESEKFTKNFNAYSPTMLAFNYIGINSRLPKFSDIRVRKALTHLVDVDKIIENIAYGLGERTMSPISSYMKKEYNHNLVPIPFDPNKAKELLKEAGWQDSDQDGTIDKVIDGELTPMTINYLYNSGNEVRKSVGLIFKEEARKIGIDVVITSLDFTVMLDKIKQHDFEMTYGGWVQSPVPWDPKQIWHTDAYNGGDNYVGFGNAETDALIESIRSELDADKRAKLYKKLQQIIYDSHVYIFLYSPAERIAISKRFENAAPSVMRPGFFEPGFQLVASQTAE